MMARTSSLPTITKVPSLRNPLTVEPVDTNTTDNGTSVHSAINPEDAKLGISVEESCVNEDEKRSKMIVTIRRNLETSSHGIFDLLHAARFQNRPFPVEDFFP